MDTTTIATTTISIIKTTNRGALLITDGVRVAWVQGRTRRMDGSFTPSALDALSKGMTTEEWEAKDAQWRAARDAEKAERERAFQEGKEQTTVTIPSASISEGSERSWKVRTPFKKWMYGKQVSVYNYLPKSVVSVSVENGVATITMPKWFLSKNNWLTQM